MTTRLGVDLGTTAVKCALVDATTRATLATATRRTDAAYACASDSDAAVTGNGRAEQDVGTILRALVGALAELQASNAAAMAALSAVALCGQMHGIVWWRAATVAEAVRRILAPGDGADAAAAAANAATASGSMASTSPPTWSRLITWEDRRCSPAFLDDCRERIGDGASPLASGYGLATYAHTLVHDPTALEGFDACGTIQDLVAFVLCGHSSAINATIDTTNAFSWGGMDLEALDWHEPTLAALGIPRSMLPTITTPGTIIGRVPDFPVFGGLAPGATVLVPMGDHPCSVVALTAAGRGSTLRSGDTLCTLVNIGTSAQLAMLLPDDLASSLPRTTNASFEVRPHVIDGQRLGVAAALSGGNIFAWLVRRCQDDLTALGIPTIPTEDELYERLVALGMQCLNTTLVFTPTLNGERSDPTSRGSLRHLGTDNGGLGDTSAALARGLIQNLLSMLPDALRAELRSGRILGTGNALLRNPLLRHFLAWELNDPSALTLHGAADAAVGAALVLTRTQETNSTLG